MNRNTIAIPEHTRTYKTNDDPKGQCREANGSVELSKSIHTLLFASLYSLNVGGDQWSWSRVDTTRSKRGVHHNGWYATDDENDES